MIQFNALLWVFLSLFALRALCRSILTGMNIRHLMRFGHQVPEVFRGEMDDETLSRMTNYTVESSRLGTLQGLFDDGVLLVILLGGVLPWLTGRIETLHHHTMVSGLLFFALLMLAGELLDIPFSLYSAFGIEKKYGFSTITAGLWISDAVKNLAVSLVLSGLLLAPLLAMILYLPDTWWFWAWLFFAFFQMLILWLYPVAIAPLFNRYEPVQNDDLRDRIISLMEKAGLRVAGVYQVDASRRSKHSNAYFTGIGRTKRIVLYDTLIGSHGIDEILSVLAHEAGHWKKRHVLKQLLFIEASSLIVFYVLYRLLEWPLLYGTFGFAQPLPYAGLFLIGALLKPVPFFLTPVGSAVSRRFEREADDFSFSLLGTTEPLAKALKRLAKENLANLHPHPVYAWFYYSHPPLTERIARLQSMDGKGS